jgi:hypothetical protein
MSEAEERDAEMRAAWPKDVTPIDFDSVGKLGVNRSSGMLYWDGKPVQLRQRLELSWWQTFVAGVTAIAVILGGVGGFVQGFAAGHDLACKRGWLSCPK